MKNANVICKTLSVLFGFSLLASGALAADLVSPRVPDSRSVVVDLDDYDLGTPAEAKALVGRLQRAARQACDRNDDFRSSFPYNARGACSIKAFNEAVGQINRSLNIDLEAIAATAATNRHGDLAASSY